MRVAWLVASQATGILFADVGLWSRPLAYGAGSLALAAACAWPRVRGACACLLAACAGAAGLAGQLAAAERAQPWRGAEGRAEASVAALARTPWGWRAELADVVWLEGRARSLPGRVRLSGEAPRPGVADFAALQVGDRVRVALRLRAIGGLRNPGRRDPRLAAARAGLGLAARLEHPALHARLAAGRLQALHVLRARVAEALVAAGPGGPLLAALAVGERGRIARETRDAFAALGASHLLAVSGLHLGLAALLGFAGVQRLLARAPGWAQTRDPRSAALAAACVLALGYALLSGWGVPVRRALVLLLALGVGVARGRPTQRLAPVWCAAGWVLATEPHALFSAGAQLSFAASAALLLAAARAHEGERLGLLATSATALAVTAPLAALHFGSRAPLALFANALLVPWTASLLLPAALSSAGAVALELPGQATLLLVAERLAASTAGGVSWAATHGAAPPTSGPPALAWVAVGAALGGLALRVRTLAAKLLCALLVSGLLAVAPGVVLGPRPPRALFLDVGQGDSSLVQAGGVAVLIDAGGRLPGGADLGELAVVPALRALGVERLALLIVSHADLDHRGGVVSVIEALPVDALWLPLGAVADPSFAKVLRAAARRGVPVAERGAHSEALDLGALRVSPLWPAADFSGSRNDRSLVVRVEAAGSSLLFPGDIEAAGEAALLASGTDLRAEVLKLAHHGSRTSSRAEFLAAVSPEVAVAAAPCRSRFGMPHAEVLARLRAAGASLWWTGRDGAVWLRLGARRASWGHGLPARCPRGASDR